MKHMACIIAVHALLLIINPYAAQLSAEVSVSNKRPVSVNTLSSSNVLSSSGDPAATEPAVPASANVLTPETAQAIAKEAYIYGYPIVENYSKMYTFAVAENDKQYKAPFNVLKNEAAVFTPASTNVLTPNCNIARSYLWMDLRTEPLILGVPEIEEGRYYAIQLIDLYTFNFDYIGTRTTGNGAGRYLIAGPGWNGLKPDGVDKVIRSETEFVLARYQTQLFSPDDLDDVKEIQSRYSVQPLSGFLGTSAPPAAAVIDFPVIDSKAVSSDTFFEYLNFLLQFCPVIPSETGLLRRFALIGIGPDAGVEIAELRPEIQAALKNGIADSHAAINAMMPKASSVDIFGTRDYLQNDYLKRAVAAKVNLYGNSKEEALYPLYLTDAESVPLDAARTNYIMTFAADQLPPVNAFWSLTLYDAKTRALVSNPIHRYLVDSSMLEQLARNPDDGLTLFVQHASPGEEKETNWLPAPDGAFYMVMRLYWPKAEALDGTWIPPLIWPEKRMQETIVVVPEGLGTAQEVKPTMVDKEAKPEMERPSIWGEPTEVQIGIYIVDVDEVNSAQQNFAASVFYQARWKNPFLRHKGPGPIHRGVTEVWNPRLTILGQQNIWRSFPEAVEIHPNGEVIYRQRIWGHFSQPLNLREFPFDTQVLTIHLVAAGLQEEQVKMIPLMREGKEMSGLAQTFSVPDFKVISWQAEPIPYFAHKDGQGTAGYRLQILMGRSPIYYLLKVVIPLCLIVIMSWLPRWINSEQIGTNVGISTTAFLTLVAYLFAITVLLPRVSYITRLDRFIFLSTIIVFAGLVHTVADTVTLHTDKKALMERINRWSRVVYPLIVAVVLVISFIV